LLAPGPARNTSVQTTLHVFGAGKSGKSPGVVRQTREECRSPMINVADGAGVPSTGPGPGPRTTQP
jgi:hypothetical protein